MIFGDHIRRFLLIVVSISLNIRLWKVVSLSLILMLHGSSKVRLRRIMRRFLNTFIFIIGSIIYTQILNVCATRYLDSHIRSSLLFARLGLNMIYIAVFKFISFIGFWLNLFILFMIIIGYTTMWDLRGRIAFSLVNWILLKAFLFQTVFVDDRLL